MHPVRRLLAVSSLVLITFVFGTPAFAQVTQTIACGPNDSLKCEKIDKSCTVASDCENNIGVSACFNGSCYLELAAKREYERSKTDFVFGLIEVQNEIGELTKPALQIKIPGLEFSDIGKTLDKEGYIHVPYIGELIAALYKYGIAIASIVAVVLIIKNGVAIILSAGGDQKMAAYHQIGQVVIGLVILWSSYAFLYTINPNLVEFKPLRIQYIEPVPLVSYDKKDPVSEPGATQGLSQSGYIKFECKAQPPNKTLSDSLHDEIFERYGNCVSYDWRILKAMSFVESAHRAEVVNCSGFTGLFQTKTKYANTFLGKYKLNVGEPNDYEGIGKINPKLQTPEMSTMVGTIILNGSIQLIEKKCPALDEASIWYFVYIGHQSGTGALKYVLDKTCDTNDSPKHIKQFYTNNKTNRSADDIANESDTGAKRLQKFVNDLGIPAVTAKAIDANKCPLTNSALRKI